MKTLSLLLIAGLSLLKALSSSAQKVHYCDSSKSYWICERAVPAIILELNGQVQTVNEDNKEAVFIGPHLFMFNLYGKYDFIDKKTIKKLEKGTYDSALQKEAELLMNFVKKKPAPVAMQDFTVEKAPLPADKFWVILKGNTILEKGDKSNAPCIKTIIQAFTISDENVLCISTVQFSDQVFDDVLEDLMRIINSYRVAEDGVDLEMICEGKEL